MKKKVKFHFLNPKFTVFAGFCIKCDFVLFSHPASNEEAHFRAKNIVDRERSTQGFAIAVPSLPVSDCSLLMVFKF